MRWDQRARNMPPGSSQEELPNWSMQLKQIQDSIASSQVGLREIEVESVCKGTSCL
jgi:hypothetical protein